ncbi:sensor histidine kinase [Clostridium tagluense]|uniref:sensor histidine kinase n=1 Tax=Clostridium tagluense TaxID=360422 RepID=UPI001C0E5AAA|nr:sensor histidine kinase [Clostridium tagluense]MBU3129286.1 sensor histidine kinase [Clostridium tagluense]MCB2310225.1 sensor histidine kinase [Clostridium tagluense]MCB2315133.1 sensor histidine kinase [Clostridium tagluense]MCB2319925.1 sensor histidine kinase [Clostridium tagluense]MCB2324876.1 sensor histidine kinase [Clostridium tagluense]
MCLTKLILMVLKKEKTAIIIYLLNTGVLVSFYYLIFNSREIMYPITVSLFFLMIFIIYKTIEYNNFYIRLGEAKKSPNYKGKFDNNVEVFEAISEIHDSYIKKFYKMQNRIKERDTLMAQWVHNMKTSITVIDLACEKGLKELENSDFINDIIEENKKLQDNLEETLNLFRLDEFAKDYIPEKVNLRELVNSAVNNKKREFIYSKVYPKVIIDEKYNIYTDKKWSKYMLEQIIANAIKYSEKENSYVTFSVVEEDNYITLCVEDKGIGIRKEDISRVFQAFFTGINGRNNKKSSGIGLYMVKLVADELGHEIHIRSKVGEGTIVEISYLSKL